MINCDLVSDDPPAARSTPRVCVCLCVFVCVCDTGAGRIGEERRVAGECGGGWEWVRGEERNVFSSYTR